MDKSKRFIPLGLMVLLLLLSRPLQASQPQSWTLVNPKGIVFVEPIKMNPHNLSLENKTVVLRWNGKHNGDNFLTRIAELLEKNVKGVKVVKVWEPAPETALGGRDADMAGGTEGIAKKIASYKPDIVIAAQAD